MVENCILHIWQFIKTNEHNKSNNWLNEYSNYKSIKKNLKITCVTTFYMFFADKGVL